MSDALRAALSLVSAPAQVRAMRKLPLPPDTKILLLIASGDEEASLAAAGVTHRTPDHLVAAASFFIEQILMCPDADSYRTLGLDSTAPNSELRAHMALLMRWVHPDLDASGKREKFAHRVLRAWDDIKTPERRAHYDAGLSQPSGPAVSKARADRRWRLNPPPDRTSWRRRIKSTLQRLLHGS